MLAFSNAFVLHKSFFSVRVNQKEKKSSNIRLKNNFLKYFILIWKRLVNTKEFPSNHHFWEIGNLEKMVLCVVNENFQCMFNQKNNFQLLILNFTILLKKAHTRDRNY